MIPGIRIVGTYTPPFGPLMGPQEYFLRSNVAASKPDIFWVGISTPNQERFMAHYFQTLDVKLMAGVGAAFDIHAGLISDSPNWIKVCGLQWLDRWRKEPKRLWKRYARNNPGFIWNLAMQATGAKRFALD